jgi:hypothetical protein
MMLSSLVLLTTMARNRSQARLTRGTKQSRISGVLDPEYAGLLGNGDHKASSAGRFCGLKVRKQD